MDYSIKYNFNFEMRDHDEHAGPRRMVLLAVRWKFHVIVASNNLHKSYFSGLELYIF